MSVEKQVIIAKKIGVNLSLMIGEEKLTKKVTKEEYEQIKPEIERYNKKNSKIGLERITKFMKPIEIKQLKEAETKAVALKGQKQLVKKEIKKETIKEKEVSDFNKELAKLMALGEVNPQQMQDLINKHKAVKEVSPVAQSTSTPRRGER